MALADRRIRRTAPVLGLALTLSACLVAAPAAGAKNVVKLKKAGQTLVKLSSAASKSLKSAGFTLKPVSSAKAKSGGIAFPISGGTLDPQLKDGASISHSGGIRLSKGSTTVTLSSPRITIGAGGSSLSVAIGGASGALFTLNTSKAKIVRRSPVGSWEADGIGLRLNAEGAKALNSKFKTKFKSGDAFGTAAVSAKLAELIISSGETTLTLGSAFTTLTSAGLNVQPVSPATLSGGVVTLPISPRRSRRTSAPARSCTPAA